MLPPATCAYSKPLANATSHGPSDCVVILTDHRVFDRARILRDAKLIVDTRNFLGEDGKGNSKVVRL